MLSPDESTNGVVGYCSDTDVTKHAFTYGGIKVDDVPEKYKESLKNEIESIDESFNDGKGMWEVDA